MDTPTLLFIAGVFVIAGTVKGVVGLGLPTIAMGLLATTMPPATAAATLLVPTIVTNVWQMLQGERLLLLARRLAPMLAGILIGALLGRGWLAAGGALGLALLGAVLVLYAGIGLARWQWRLAPGAEWWVGPLAGLATGLATAATGIAVMPLAPYLQALGLDRDDFVQALGLAFTVSMIGLASSLAGTVPTAMMLGAPALAAMLGAAVGMLIGQGLRTRLDAQRFRLMLFVSLGLLGSWLAARALS
jgi:hypothetical protein